MKGVITRAFCIDGDTVHITFTYDVGCRVWIGDYPFFEEEPRITPSGRLWRNVTYDGCPHGEGTHGDCGTCPHLVRQEPGDLIGVCFHDGMR